MLLIWKKWKAALEAYEKNAEKILSEMKSPAAYAKFYLTPTRLTAYNHQNMDDLIKARYYTGGLVPKFQQYCNNIVVYAYDLNTQNEIPVNQGRSFLTSDKGKNKIVISSDFLKSVVDFKVGDNLVLNMSGNSVEFEVIVSDFILSSVLQLTYQPNVVLEASMFIASIAIYIGATVLPLNRHREQKLYLLPRDSE